MSVAAHGYAYAYEDFVWIFDGTGRLFLLSGSRAYILILDDVKYS